MDEPPKIVTVIPARLASSRLSEKLLLRETGKTLLQHTWEAVREAALPAETIVAVDHRRLQEEVEAFGGTAIRTSEECRSGGDRVAEIARQRPDVEIFVNVQGDEPELPPSHVDLVATRLLETPEVEMSTLACPFADVDAIADPANVKVVLDQRGRALYFSRAVIPHIRDETVGEATRFLHHLGIYAYRRSFLLKFAALPQGPLEAAERLEQLRALENGFPIAVGVVASSPPGIDTRQDYEAFKQRQANR